MRYNWSLELHAWCLIRSAMALIVPGCCCAHSCGPERTFLTIRIACARAGVEGLDASKKRPIEEDGENPSKRANLGDGTDKPNAIKVPAILTVCFLLVLQEVILI